MSNVCGDLQMRVGKIESDGFVYSSSRCPSVLAVSISVVQNKPPLLSLVLSSQIPGR